jgi:phage terminase large subunit-like protein
MHASNRVVDAYITGVLDGSVPVNELAHLSIERHIADLERWPCLAIRVPDPPDRDEIERRADEARAAAAVAGDEFYFDENAAQAILDFYRLCCLTEGELAGQEFVPLPYQATVDWITHGWMRTETGTRRFGERWMELGRGNGKSTWSAAHELYMMSCDGEPSAKVYAVATEKIQAASAVWGIAAAMVLGSPELASEFEVQDSFNNHRIFIPGTGCEFRPIKPDPKKADSLSAQSISADEIHAWPQRETYTKFKDATGKRLQGMFTNITSAGDDRPKTLYDEQHDHAVRVLRGWQDRSFEDNTFFAIIFAIDSKHDGCAEDANWEDEAEWYKANPSLGFPGTGVQLYYLRGQANRAKVDPEVLRDFLRFHLGRRIGAKIKSISGEQWKLCGAPAVLADLEHQAGEAGPEQLLGPETARILRALADRDWAAFNGRPCFAGIDLSSTRDLTALSVYFPGWESWPFETYRFWAWLPKENLKEACDRDRAPYDQWAREGWLELTEGDEIDEEVIFGRLLEVAETYQVVQWAYDQWHATQLKNNMFAATSIEMVKFVQDLPNFGEPTMLFLDSVAGRKLCHDGNPLAHWCATNVVCKQDAHGNKKPHKALSNFRIDPIVAAIMARGRAIVTPIPQAPQTPNPADYRVESW